MTTPTFRTAVTSLGAALLLTLTACSGGGTSSGGTDPDDLPKGPLDEMFEEMYGNWDEDQGARDMMRVEEITAECMAEEGFEYTPVDQTQFMGMAGDELDVEWGTLEFAEQYGYGATTNPYGDGEVTEEEPAQEFVDPNQEYVESMSETELEAYNAALWGNQEYIEGEEVEYDWTTAGCQGKAQHEVYEGGMEGDEFADLQEEMNGMWEAVQQDPRITELDSKWSSCMADAGFDGFAAVYDAETSIYDRTNKIHESAWEDVELDENATEEDWEAINEQIQAQLAEITEEEIELAVADYTCREEIDFMKVQAEVNVDHQQEFYDAHKDELDAWLAAYQESAAD